MTGTNTLAYQSSMFQRFFPLPPFHKTNKLGRLSAASRFRLVQHLQEKVAPLGQAPANIQTGLPGGNTLAYLSVGTVDKEKSFITSAPTKLKS